MTEFFLTSKPTDYIFELTCGPHLHRHTLDLFVRLVLIDIYCVLLYLYHNLIFAHILTHLLVWYSCLISFLFFRFVAPSVPHCHTCLLRSAEHWLITARWRSEAGPDKPHGPGVIYGGKQCSSINEFPLLFQGKWGSTRGFTECSLIIYLSFISMRSSTVLISLSCLYIDFTSRVCAH